MQISQLSRKIHTNLERMTKLQITIVSVIVAVGFSQLLVVGQCLIFLGKVDYFTLLVGFLTPLIDSFILVWLLLVILSRSKLIKSLVDQSNDEIYVLEKETGNIVYCNNSAQKNNCYSDEELEQLDFTKLYISSEIGKNWEDIVEKIESEGQISMEGQVVSKENRAYDVDINLSADKNERQKYIISVVRDITQRKVMEKRLEILATTDPLTGIANRRKFMDYLEADIKRANRYNSPFSIAICDVDMFKKVNDIYGHDVGDYVLQHLTRTMNDKLRATDLLARYGGEEFVILFPETESSGAEVISERLRHVIENTEFATVGRITASFGVSQYRPTEEGVELLKRIDLALYKAKEQGRNRVILM